MKKVFFVCIFFISAGLNAPDDLIAKIAARLNEYAAINPDEHLCLLTNQERFCGYDTIFFSAYYYRSNLQPIQTKRIFSAALFSIEGKEIAKINFSIVAGHAFNQIAIPRNCPPGIFSLVAADPESGEIFFSKHVHVVGRKAIADASLWKTQFAFEGSRFVINAKNRLVVNTIPNTKINLTVSGILKSQTESDSSGFASFEILPTKPETYALSINGKTTELPLPSNIGCAIKLIEGAIDKKIEIDLPAQNINPFLLLINNNKLIASTSISENNDEAFVYTIKNEKLPNGITHALVISKTGEVLATRSFYHFHRKLTANLTLEKPYVHQRDHLIANLQLHNSEGAPVTGDLTFTVNLLGSHETKPTMKIEEQFFLNPIIAEFVPNIPREESKRQFIINEILVLRPPNLIPWDQIISGKIIKRNYTKTLKLKAHLQQTDFKSKPSDSIPLSCFLQNSMIGYEGYIKNNYVEVPILYDFFGREEAFYSIDERFASTNTYKLEIDTANITPPINYAVNELNTLDHLGELGFKIQLVKESYAFFRTPIVKKSTATNLNERFEDEAMGTDFEINVDEYVVFPTMVDLVKEVIPFLEVKTRKEKVTTRLLIKQKNFFKKASSSPLFVIDGSLTKNEKTFLDLKPVDVFRVKIINDANRLPQFGSLGANGIVLVETKKRSKDKIKENMTISILGLNKPVIKQSMTNFSPRIPDLRTTLAWIPLLKTNSQGIAALDIYTSDLKGEFYVTVRGKTTEGIPFEASQILSVK